MAWGTQHYGTPQLTTISASGTQGAVQDLDTEQGGRTEVAAAPNGAAVVAWQRNSDNSLHARRVSTGTTLGPDVQLSAAGEQIAQYRLAMTTSGVSTALWTDYQDLRIAHVLGDGTAVLPTTVSTAPLGYCSAPIGPPPPPDPGPVPAPAPPPVCQIELALSVDNANNAQGTWIGADNRIRARRIPFGAPAEATRVLSPPSDSLSRNPVSVTAPSGVGTTMWLDSSSGRQQLYVAPSNSGVVEDPTEPPPPPPAPPPPLQPPDPSQCSRLTIIGVAGSGENGAGRDFNPSYGHVIKPFLETLLDRLPPAIRNDTRSFPLDYPANEVSTIPGKAEYFHSKDKGVEALTFQLTTDPCANKTRYVLAGYSQGAHVIGDVLAGNSGKKLRKRIVAVALFADPVFDPLDNDLTQLGSWDPSWAGVLITVGAHKLIGAGSNYPVYTYCHSGDAVCQGSSRHYETGTWAFRHDRALSDEGNDIHYDYNASHTTPVAKRVSKEIIADVKTR